MIRRPNPKEQPSAQDEAMFNFFQEHVFGQGLSDAEVDRVLRTRFRLSKKQFDEAYLRVWLYRHAES